MAVRTKSSIFRAALSRTGNGVSSDADGSGLWTALEANYDEIVRATFEAGDGNYPFGRTRTTLTSRSAGVLGYDDSYAVPNDCLHVVEVFYDDYSASDLYEPWDFDGENNAVVLNAAGRTIEIEYVRAGQESKWSASFALAVQRRLEAVIKDVLEESEESIAKDNEADLQILKAGVKSAKNRSQKRVWNKNRGRLVRARRGQRVWRD